MISNIIALFVGIFALNWGLGLVRAIISPDWYWDKKFNETGIYGHGFPMSLFVIKLVQISIAFIVIYFLIIQNW